MVAELNTIFSDSDYAADVEVDDLTWMESLEILCEGKPMLTVPGEYDEHDTFVRISIPDFALSGPMRRAWLTLPSQFAKSLVEPSADPLTEESVSLWFKYLVSKGQASSNVTTPPSFFSFAIGIELI